MWCWPQSVCLHRLLEEESGQIWNNSTVAFLKRREHCNMSHSNAEACPRPRMHLCFAKHFSVKNWLFQMATLWAFLEWFEWSNRSWALSSNEQSGLVWLWAGERSGISHHFVLLICAGQLWSAGVRTRSDLQFAAATSEPVFQWRTMCHAWSHAKSVTLFLKVYMLSLLSSHQGKHLSITCAFPPFRIYFSNTLQCKHESTKKSSSSLAEFDD